MTHNWKPGDDIPDRVGGYTVVLQWNEVALTLLLRAAKEGYPRGGYSALVKSVRRSMSDSPLVVIDPEDREQVERLLATYYQHVSGGRHESADYADLSAPMQAALREFAAPTPPKPKPLLERLKDRAPDGLIDPALAEHIVKEWLADNADEMGVVA